MVRLLTIGLVALVGYSVERNIGAKDRAVGDMVNRDPMAQFVPPGATLTDEFFQPSATFSTARIATVRRRFTVPPAQGASAYAATLQGARAAGWRMDLSDPGFAFGNRPDRAEMRLQVRLSSTEPGTTVKNRTMFIEISAQVP